MCCNDGIESMVIVGAFVSMLWTFFSLWFLDKRLDKKIWGSQKLYENKFLISGGFLTIGALIAISIIYAYLDAKFTSGGFKVVDYLVTSISITWSAIGGAFLAHHFIESYKDSINQ